MCWARAPAVKMYRWRSRCMRSDRLAPHSPLNCDVGLAQVKDVASYVTSSHDHDGVAEAIERFLL